MPAVQRQHRLIQALFEKVTEFGDSVFYDVSTWTLPLAFAMPHAELTGSLPTDLQGPRLTTETPAPRGFFPGEAPAVAYAFEWSGYYAPRALARLLGAGVKARLATLPFAADTDRGRRTFAAGTVVVPLGLQEVTGDELRRLLETAAQDDAIDVYGLGTGLTAEGVDLGSPSLLPLTAPKPLLVVGRGVAAYRAGEIWHLLDHRFDVPLPLIEMHVFEELDLAPYSHVILVDGSYRELSGERASSLKRWVEGGGVLIAAEGALSWVEEAVLAPPEKPAATEAKPATAPPAPEAPAERQEPERPEPPRPAYAAYERDRAAELVSGAVFAAELDLTHPLAFGYPEKLLPLFKSDTRVLAPSANPYENVALYTGSPLISGYASKANQERFAGTAAVTASRLGDGLIVRFADHPDFRAYWHGTHKLLFNALFFGSAVKQTQPPSEW